MTSSLKIQTHYHPPTAARELLARVRWGSDGGLQYQVLAPPAWHKIPQDSRFLSAEIDNELVGIYVLSKQSWGYLRQLLAVDPGHLGTGIGRALVSAGANWAAEQNVTVAGTIETTNHRSLHLSLDAGYSPVARLGVRTLTRQRRQPSPNVRQANESDLPTILEALVSQEQSWFEPSQVLLSECWVTSDLTAGVQIFTHKWALSNIGLHPILNRVVLQALPMFGINPSKFLFATGHYWWGDPTRWEEILVHTMHFLSLQAVVLAGDEKSPSWTNLLKHVRMGAIGTAIGKESMEVTSNSTFPTPLVFTPGNAL